MNIIVICQDYLDLSIKEIKWTRIYQSQLHLMQKMLKIESEQPLAAMEGLAMRDLKIKLHPVKSELSASEYHESIGTSCSK